MTRFLESRFFTEGISFIVKPLFISGTVGRFIGRSRIESLPVPPHFLLISVRLVLFIVTFRVLCVRRSSLFSPLSRE